MGQQSDNGVGVRSEPVGRFALGDLELDIGRQSVTRAGVEIPLPPRSFELLVVLVQAAPNVLNGDQLMARAWKGLVVNPEAITQRVKLLRDALGDDPRSPRYVQVVRGRGYRLAVPVRNLAADGGRATSIGPAQSAAHARMTRRPTWLVAALAGLCTVVLLTAWWLKQSSDPAAIDEGKAGTGIVKVGLPPRTVAVLPFQMLGGDPSEEYIGLGIAEVVRNRLSTSGSLMVIARSSSFAVSDQSAELGTIGRLLGARYLVQGAVQKQDDMLRVSVQLSDAQTGRQLQGLTTDRTMSELFALQDEIAAVVAEALDVVPRQAHSGTDRLDAHLEYLQGLAALSRFRVPEAERAAGHFRQARHLDPAFAAAYAGEAKALMAKAELEGRGQRSVTAAALALLDQALALDPELAEAYFARAFLTTDPDRAEADFRLGLALAPNHSDGHLALSEWLGIQAYLQPFEHRARRPGAEAEAQWLMERAMLLDPLRPRPRYLHALSDYRATGDADAFEAALLAVLRMDPNYTQALTRLSLLQAGRRGRLAEGIALIERALAADPYSAFAARTAFDLYLSIGDVAAARDFAEADQPEWEVAAVLRESPLVSAAPQPGSGGRAIGSAHGMANVLLIRDQALRDHAFARHAELLRSEYCLPAVTRDEDCVRIETAYAALALAQLAIAAGDRRRGRQLIESLLAVLTDRAGFGRSDALAQLLRAAALLSLGGESEALIALAAVAPSSPTLAWWVLLEHDQVFDAVRDSAEFRALLTGARSHAASERAAVERLRESGQIPQRPTISP